MGVSQVAQYFALGGYIFVVLFRVKFKCLDGIIFRIRIICPPGVVVGRIAQCYGIEGAGCCIKSFVHSGRIVGIFPCLFPIAAGCICMRKTQHGFCLIFVVFYDFFFEHSHILLPKLGCLIV
ncbi:unknown [Bacteroides sp. CAG:927]|nr:unknown [Bacteroides sp. CAG:927]